MSQLLQVTMPMSMANHPYQFPDQPSFDAFSTAVTQWITKEQ